jgi:hypothetical protein
MSVAQFAEHGFTTMNIFDASDVRAAQADIVDQIDRIAEALYVPAGHCLPGTPLAERLDRMAASELSYAKLMRTAICTDAHRGPRLTGLAETPALLAAAEKLANRPIGGSIRRVRTSIRAFPEYHHGWHSDVAIDDGSRCGSVCITAWIPLDDTGPNNGGLEVVPCRRTTPFRHERTDNYEIPESELTSLPRVQPTCTAGSALFIDRFTPHRTLPVQHAARFALVVWFIAA